MKESNVWDSQNATGGYLVPDMMIVRRRGVLARSARLIWRLCPLGWLDRIGWVEVNARQEMMALVGLSDDHPVSTGENFKDLLSDDLIRQGRR